MTATVSDIARIASERAFGAKLVTNIHRGLLVEAIVSTALCPEWLWCSEDYAPYDFRHSSGTKLEVKQSAACQSWETVKPSSGSWDIKARKQTWDGAQWIDQPGRAADIYVLAWHPVAERAQADHRDPLQWRFRVIRTVDLPGTDRISFVKAEKLASDVGIAELAAEVARIWEREV